LIDATERALARCERKADTNGMMSALKLLNELRKRHRAAELAPLASPSASSPHQRPPEERRDVGWLVEELKRIYGIKKDRVPPSSDALCVEQLKSLVERRADTDPISCALATRLASRVLNRPLDEETEREVGVDAEEDSAD
jgi:hypothetical protein